MEHIHSELPALTDQPYTPEQLRAWLNSVKIIAGGFVEQTGMRFEDLFSAGCEGLASALTRARFNQPSTNDFLMKRIRGAIKDYLRGMDPLTRVERQWLRRKTRVLNRARVENPGQDIREIAEKLKIDLDLLLNLRAIDESARGYFPLDPATVSSIEDPNAENPEETVLQEERLRQLYAAMTRLSERELYVLAHCNKFLGDKSSQKVGEDLGVTGSRISQISKGILEKLRAAMAGFIQTGQSVEPERGVVLDFPERPLTRKRKSKCRNTNNIAEKAANF